MTSSQTHTVGVRVDDLTRANEWREKLLAAGRQPLDDLTGARLRALVR